MIWRKTRFEHEGRPSYRADWISVYFGAPQRDRGRVVHGNETIIEMFKNVWNDRVERRNEMEFQNITYTR